MVTKKYEIDGTEQLLGILIWATSFVSLIVGPLLIWLIKGESPFVRDNAKMYFNLVITSVIYTAVSGILVFVLIGFVLLPIVGIWVVIMTVMGIVNSINGEVRSMPLVFDFLGVLN